MVDLVEAQQIVEIIVQQSDYKNLERIAFECMDGAKALDTRLRGYDGQEVIPAKAGIQEPYRQWQAALSDL